jgi:mRNA interferase RelE/StbE
MPNYTILLTKKAEKQLDKLPENIAEPIIEAINDLAENPRPHGYKNLKKRHGYRIRIGDYRVIYEVFDDELIIDVIKLGHRREIYD